MTDPTPFPSPTVGNPYAPPQDMSPATVMGDAEQIRQAHLSHEASVKSIGLLYMLGAIILVPVGIVMFGAAFLGDSLSFDGMESRVVTAVVGLIYVGIGLLQGFTALGLRSFQPWARIASIVLSAIGLLGVPIGTLISIYFLYLLLCKKGQYLFTPEYRQIIASTPHMKYRTSLAAWILLGLVILLIIVLIIAAIVSGI
jgi:hypothetical protein